jgi:hypothetical protein
MSSPANSSVCHAGQAAARFTDKFSTFQPAMTRYLTADVQQTRDMASAASRNQADLDGRRVYGSVTGVGSK